MEALKELLVVAVGYPWLRAVQQGGEYGGSIDADLSALHQMLILWYIPGKWTGELLSDLFYRWWCGESGTLLGMQAEPGSVLVMGQIEQTIFANKWLMLNCELYSNT